ncbi:glycosyltransferase family 4 protein [Flavobacterium xueshanense]|uniref:Glycosyltransferase involved in cell wall bisynthesis n=1 Tax=Flavobacterium xueshanense TaxID=935223 RepID=A0A1I2CLE9_9FLAO|nr:glycosyltransferase family 4 protein [Flavobacterium xueshanense]SFE69111.1 Glycosyltransferase involved in cell wall bisynthesis [Flavobacterium xueshanense]
MNVLFLTMARIGSLDDRGVYTDLLRKFFEEGHNVYVVTPMERRENKKTNIIKEKGGVILNIQTLNIQKTNIIEKGIGTLAIEYQFLRGIKKYLSDVEFDLITYSTPPITFSKVISYIKNRDNAYSYLMLKDIFPQNAIDMKMLKEGSLLHKFFLKKERKLYEVSDAIGCMSEANKIFLLTHNPNIALKKVEVNPNSISPLELFQAKEENNIIKKKYGLPLNKKIFVYGGNLGKPQGVDFLLETITATKRKDVFFLVIGSGTEYNRIKKWFETQQPKNAMMMKGLPKDDYEFLLRACDVGMLFLHRDFTIPNFPSRLLSYLEIKLPVLAATDPNTDVGSVIEKAKCGYWILSGDQKEMQNAINKFCDDEENYLQMKENAWKLLVTEFHVDRSYQLIKKRLENV